MFLVYAVSVSTGAVGGEILIDKFRFRKDAIKRYCELKAIVDKLASKTGGVTAEDNSCANEKGKKFVITYKYSKHGPQFSGFQLKVKNVSDFGFYSELGQTTILKDGTEMRSYEYKELVWRRAFPYLFNRNIRIIHNDQGYVYLIL